MNKRPRRPARRVAPADSLVFAFLGTAETVEARLEAAVGVVGLSLAKVGVLHHLAEAREALPLSELAQHQNCVRSNITQLIDRLEKDGLVRRRPDPEDRRGVLAALTATGRRAYAQAMLALAREQAAIVSALSAGDAANLKAALAVLAR